MKTIITLLLIVISFSAFCQQSEYYQKAATLYSDAANKTKCPERAAYLRKLAAWNQCWVDVLAGRASSCGEEPNRDQVPSCDADMISNGVNDPSSNTSYSNQQQNSDEIANSLLDAVDGISELAKIKLDNNSESDTWFLISGGANLGGNAGPIAGTIADVGQLSGYFFSAHALCRNGLSFMSSFSSLKSTYFHSFRAKSTDGNYRNYIGRTEIEMPFLDFSIGKDFTGTEGRGHFIPNIGADMIYDIENTFSSTNISGVEYEEIWDKDLFFSLHAGVQMFFLFSNRFGLQGGGKYVYFPSENGNVFKTNNFLTLP